MNIDEIADMIVRDKRVTVDDYFDDGIFYYLNTEFPELTVRECVEIAYELQSRVMDDIDPDK